MNILIVEPSVDGHHGEYLAWITRACNQAGWNVTLATNMKNASHPSAAGWRAEVDEVVDLGANNLVMRENPNVFTMVHTMFRYWRVFKSFYKNVSARKNFDLVLLPYLDYCSHAIALLGSPFETCPWVGILMRPAFHYRRLGIASNGATYEQLRSRLFVKLLQDPTARAIFTIDETLYEFACASGIRYGKLHFLPDPVDAAQSVVTRSARAKLAIRNDDVVVVSYGALSLRKGVRQLLEAAIHPECDVHVKVMLAGCMDEAVQQLVSSETGEALVAQDRLHILNKYMSKEEEELILGGADVVWLGYDGHDQMSGVLVLAGQYGLPTVACNRGLIGWLTKKYECGLVVEINDAKGVARALTALCTNRQMAENLGRNGKSAFELHTVEHASKKMLGIIGAE